MKKRMANTTIKTIQQTNWTEIAPAGTEGFVTNASSNKKIIYAERNELPSAGSVNGHTLDFDEEPYFSFKMEAGQAPYAVSVNGEAKLAVTLK
jgi:hypothetical protein